MKKYYFANYVFVSVKKYSEERTNEIIEKIRFCAAKNGYKMMRLNDGFIMSYDLAKGFVKNLRFYCSRFFNTDELVKMRENNLLSQEQFAALTA